MAVDDIFSTKKTDGKNLDNNPATNEVHIKESNQNLIPPLSTNEYKQLRVNPRKWSACSNCCQSADATLRSTEEKGKVSRIIAKKSESPLHTHVTSQY